MPDDDKLTTSDIADDADSPRERMPDAVPDPEDEKRVAHPRANDGAQAQVDDGHAALLDDAEAQDLRQRWGDIQTGFVDKPKDSVSQADELVAETIKRLARGFADERDNLEGVWSQGGDVSTEDLRVALQRYRSFFERLLNA